MIKALPLLAAALLVGAPVLGAAPASAETLNIVGTWDLAKADKLLPSGERVTDYGENPHGIAIFTADGRYVLEIFRADRVKFASGDKFNGTPEEYKAASLRMSVSFGRYSIDPEKRQITFHVDRSSFPNQDDATSVRAYEQNGDEISWKVSPRADGSIPITVLRRAK